MRVNLGGGLTVTATERWLSEIRAGRAYIAGQNRAATAGVHSALQLHNPSGSGVTALVRALFASVTVAGTELSMRRYDTQLATSSTAGRNLLAGGADSVVRVRWENIAAPVGTAFGEVLMPQYTPVALVSEWFIELGEGEGIVIFPSVVNVGCNMLAQWCQP